MINARVETAAEKPAFRRAFEHYRCLIIADGFYEWRRTPGGRKQPFCTSPVTTTSRSPSPGCGRSGMPTSSGRLRTCTILTTPANPAIAPLHDRMPVILAPGHEPDWLDLDAPSERLDELLTGLPARHTALTEVGFAVNDVRNDGPECLSSVRSAIATSRPARRQQALF